MAKLVPVTLELKGKFWVRPANFLVSKDLTFTPVALQEIRNLALFLPIVFLKDSAGAIVPVALFNLLPMGNLFINDEGRWMGRYIPFSMATYPFFLQLNERGEPVLCVEESHITDKPGPESQPLFDQGDSLDERVQQIFNFLIEREKGYRLSLDIAKKLEQAELLSPMQVTFKLGPEDEQVRKVEGLYGLDTQKYTSLEDEKFLDLRKNGALILIYAHLFSQANLDVIVQLLRLKVEMEKVSASKAKQKERKGKVTSPTVDPDKFDSLLKDLKFPES